MGILNSVSNATCRVFDSVGAVAGTVEESVEIVTNYVHNRAKSQLLTDQKIVIIETAETLNKLQKQLDADAELKATYESLAKDW
jgi:hypothetical protein